MSLRNTIKFLAGFLPLFLWHTPAEAYSLLPAPHPRQVTHADVETLAEALLNGDDVWRIKTLLSKPGADPNAQYAGQTLLMIACIAPEGNVENVRLLLDSGADINATDRGGGTALMYAAHAGKVEILKYLLQRGAKVDAVCSESSMVFKGCQLVEPNFSGVCNALVIAHCRRQVEMVKELIKAGANADVLYLGDPLIMYYGADEEMLNFFVEHGCNMSAYDQYGETILLRAIAAQRFEAAARLIQAGANVNVGTLKGNTTPLMVAVLKEDKKMVELLLKHGAKPDEVASTDDTQGITALHLAASKGNFHIVKLLLEHGATPDKEDSNGFNAFDIAKKQGHDSLAEFLKTKARIHKQKSRRQENDEEEEETESSDLVLYGGIGAGVLVLIVVVLLCRKKKPAPAPVQSRFNSQTHGAAPQRRKVVRRRPVAHAAQPVPAAPAPVAPMPLYHLALADGTQLGCYTGEQLVAMLQNGQITYDALVWTAGMANWAPLSEVSL